jgi:hypothetical protein
VGGFTSLIGGGLGSSRRPPGVTSRIDRRGVGLT